MPDITPIKFPEDDASIKGPTKSSKPKKNFEKVMRKEERKDKKHQGDDKNVKEKKDAEKTHISTEFVKEEPSSIFDLAATPAKSNEKKEPIPLQKEDMPISELKEEPKIAMSSPQPPPTIEQATTPQVKMEPQMQEMVQQIAKEMQSIKTGTQTETLITLKSEGLFAGARVAISSFETAKGEFNITFENLTQEAQALLLTKSELLRDALQQKGFVIHMITPTTQEIHPSPISSERGEQKEGQKESKDQENPREER